ncbi:hypothetical protein ACHAW5_002764 [Stephanodiscus triporus]|uniref:Uncharacterized protein n=1 Tax=Stephanodiscus triporus TaxID=2934178 RepID=A0ABD3QAU1_9STRA
MGSLLPLDAEKISTDVTWKIGGGPPSSSSSSSSLLSSSLGQLSSSSDFESNDTPPRSPMHLLAANHLDKAASGTLVLVVALALLLPPPRDRELRARQVRAGPRATASRDDDDDDLDGASSRSRRRPTSRPRRRDGGGRIRPEPGLPSSSREVVDLLLRTSTYAATVPGLGAMDSILTGRLVESLSEMMVGDANISPSSQRMRHERLYFSYEGLVDGRVGPTEASRLAKFLEGGVMSNIATGRSSGGDSRTTDSTIAIANAVVGSSFADVEEVRAWEDVVGATLTDEFVVPGKSSSNIADITSMLSGLIETYNDHKRLVGILSEYRLEIISESMEN